MMYCYDCEKEFAEEEAGAVYDKVDFWGGTCSLMTPVCPFCGSENIGEKEDE